MDNNLEKQKQRQELKKIEAGWKADMKKQMPPAGAPMTNDRQRIEKASKMRPLEELIKTEETLDSSVRELTAKNSELEQKQIAEKNSKLSHDIFLQREGLGVRIFEGKKKLKEANLNNLSFQKALQIYNSQKKLSDNVSPESVLDYTEAMKENCKLQLADVLKDLLEFQKSDGASDSFMSVVTNLELYLRGSSNSMQLAPLMDSVNSYIATHSTRRRFSTHGTLRLKKMKELKETLAVEEEKVISGSGKKLLLKDNFLRIYARDLDRAFLRKPGSDSLNDIMSSLSRYRYYRLGFTYSGSDRAKPGTADYEKTKEAFRIDVINKLNEYKTSHNGEHADEIEKERLTLVDALLKEIPEKPMTEAETKADAARYLFGDMKSLAQTFKKTPEIIKDGPEAYMKAVSAPGMTLKEKLMRYLRVEEMGVFIAASGVEEAKDTTSSDWDNARSYSDVSVKLSAATDLSATPQDSYLSLSAAQQEQSFTGTLKLPPVSEPDKIELARMLVSLQFGLLDEIKEKVRKIEETQSQDILKKSEKLIAEAFKKETEKQEKKLNRTLTDKEKEELLVSLQTKAVNQYALTLISGDPDTVDFSAVQMAVNSLLSNSIKDTCIAASGWADPKSVELMKIGGQLLHPELNSELVPKETRLEMMNKMSKLCYDKLNEQGMLKNDVKYVPLK